MYKSAYLYFLLALLVSIAGFYPSFYGQLGRVDAVRMFHGAVATIWLFMLIAQSWLYGHQRLRAHRLLGRLSLLIVPLFLLSGLLVLHAMLAGQERGFVKAFGTMLGFLDITTLAYFSWTFCMAIVHRRRLQLHARYMASTAILLLPPALARLIGGAQIPYIDSFMAAVHSAYFVTEMVLIALLASDVKSNGARKPYAILMVFTLLQHLSVLITPRLSWLDEVARAFGSL